MCATVQEERKVAVLASQERQAMLCRDLSQTYRSLKLSTDIRREELNKLEVELKVIRPVKSVLAKSDLPSAPLPSLPSLQGFQSQLSVLQHQRRQLQESLQAKSPSTAAHQLVRKKLTDGTMGVAASLASLRAALKYTTDAVSKQRGFFQLNNTTLLVSVRVRNVHPHGKGLHLRLSGLDALITHNSSLEGAMMLKFVPFCSS